MSTTPETTQCDVCGKTGNGFCTNGRCTDCCRHFCTPDGGPTGGHNRRFVGPKQLRFMSTLPKET